MKSKKYDQIKKKRVRREINNLLSCSCRMFERMGILCSHILKVLRDSLDIKESIPNEYILKRWTKQAWFESVQDINGREIQTYPKLQQTCRYRSLCSIFTKISNRASESEKADNPENLHASNVAKLVENILQLEREGDKEKEYELSPP